jgi:hypothetical protein
MYHQYAYAAGMKYEPLRSYTPKQLYELMVRYRSPLLVIMHWDTGWTHANVFKRIYGSGGTQNALIVYNDPYQRGEQEANFKDLMEQMEAAADQVAIQVMHY